MPLRPRGLVSLVFLSFALVAPMAHAGRVGGVVTLEWTAPGEDGSAGAALIYDIRCSTQPLTASNFELAKQAYYKEPAAAGTPETYTIVGLAPYEDYYFAIRTMDHRGNWSDVSNVAVRRGRSIMTEKVAEFAISEARPNPARGRVRFGVTVPRDGLQPARIDIFDALGRRVRTFGADGSAGQSSQLEWDLTDEHSSPVPAGMYIARAQFAGRVLIKRFAVIR